jgi:hypothetical protein
VVRVWLADHEDLAARGGLVDVVLVGGDAVLVDDRRAIAAPRVVDVQLAVRRELRVERQPEESLLAAADNPAPNVEERRRARSGLQRPDRSALLDDEAAAGSVAGVRQQDRIVEARAGVLERDIDRGRVEREAAGGAGERAESEENRGGRDGEAPDQRQLSASNR